ncbi:hypothetical protein OAT10_00125 [Luminiphilus sp.]|nr:hypothetical protein [Luminiphilus sp.]
MSGFNSGFSVPEVAAAAGSGVTIVEGASYDALATSAKSQDHGVLMLDTSTGFYYKNWKTDGPGIPIPVEYFDGIGGYVSNSTAGNFNYFYGPDTLSGTSGTMYDRGFSAITSTGAGSTISKAAGGPLIVKGVTSGTGESLIIFNGDTQKYHTLTINKITKAVEPTSGNYKTGVIVAHPRSSTTRTWYHFTPTRTIGKIKIQDRDSSVATIETFGSETSTQPDTAGVIDQWSIIEVDTTTSKSALTVRWLTDRDIAGTSADQDGGALGDMIGHTDTGIRCHLIGSEVQYSELHTFYFN